jgi:hypothetical protein
VNFAPPPSEAVAAAINAAIDVHLQAENDKQAPRLYLGASEIGQPCERRLGYSYHKAPREAFPGRALRRFRLGHLHEDETVAWLRGAGFTIEGQQAEYSVLDGRSQGHIDGVVTAGPVVLPYPMLWEHKIMKSTIWRSTDKHGVRSEHPTYFAQCQIYMRQFGLANALFTALNSDTSELLFEVIPFDAAFAETLVEKTVRVVECKAPEELPRVSSSSTDFQCKWCPYHERCWSVANLIPQPKPMWMR